MRVVAGREATLRLVVDDDGGQLVAANPVTVTVTRPDGTVVLASGAAAEEKTGIYTRDLPPQDRLDVLTATWEHTVAGHVRTARERLEVVGARLVPLWRLREAPLLDTLDPVSLNRVATVVEHWFRSALGFPPVPESARPRIPAVGGRRLLLTDPHGPVARIVYPLEVYEGTHDTKVLDLDDLVLSDGWIDRAAGWTPGAEVSLWLAHGWQHPNEDLAQAAAIFAAYVARTPDGKVPDRAIRISNEGTDILLSIPSPDRPTGIPDVDAVVTRYRFAL